MHSVRLKISTIILFVLSLAAIVDGQTLTSDLNIRSGGTVEVKNLFGRVDVSVETQNPEGGIPAGDEKKGGKVSLSASSSEAVTKSEIKIDNSGGAIRIETVPGNSNKRIDISLVLPARTRLKIETLEGEVRVSGDLEQIEVNTETGTIAADVPTDDLKYALFWTASRPRFLSDFELDKVKEKSGGKFEIKGRFPLDEEKKGRGDVEKEGRGDAEKGRRGDTVSEPGAIATGSEPPASAGGSPGKNTTVMERAEADQPKRKKEKPITVSLNFTTARGIILLNVPPNEVSSDLRERPLTIAAKAIIRSGDSLLMEAIRRSTPKYFGDYMRTLPPVKLEPSFAEKSETQDSSANAGVKSAVVRVTDINNRAIADLQPADFDVVENNEPREILSVRPVTAPFNLVLLLDVSGSVDNYVNFIRKAARNFVDTVDRRDRISIVIFNEDVKVVSRFTTDKSLLSESLDTFDAGGSTAYYDALAYTLAETLRPLKGERTAIVILTDGDDNRSFLPFDSMLGSIQESGALIYPLYVPSALIAAAANDPNAAIDPLRKRYMSADLTSKARAEGVKLAKVSGGVYYPITQLTQIQKAYDDIVVQLRTAYTITFRSQTAAAKGNGVSPRLKVKVNKPNAFVSIGSVVKVSE